MMQGCETCALKVRIWGGMVNGRRVYAHRMCASTFTGVEQTGEGLLWLGPRCPRWQPELWWVPPNMLLMAPISARAGRG